MSQGLQMNGHSHSFQMSCKIPFLPVLSKVGPKVQTNTAKLTKILLEFGQLSKDPEVTNRSQGWQMNGYGLWS